MKNKKIISICTIILNLIFNNVYAYVDDLPPIEIHLENLDKLSKPKTKEHISHSLSKEKHEKKVPSHLVEHKKKNGAKIIHPKKVNKIEKIENIEEEPKFVETKKAAEKPKHEQAPIESKVVSPAPLQDTRKAEIKSEDLSAPPVISAPKQEQTPLPGNKSVENIIHAEIAADKLQKNIKKLDIAPPVVVTEPAKTIAPIKEEKPGGNEKLVLTLSYLDQENNLSDSNKKLLEKFADEANKKRYNKIRIASYAPSKNANDIEVKKISLQRVISVRKILMDLGVSSAKLNVQAIEARDAGVNKIDIFVTP